MSLEPRETQPGKVDDPVTRAWLRRVWRAKHGEPEPIEHLVGDEFVDGPGQLPGLTP